MKAVTVRLTGHGRWTYARLLNRSTVER